jgi:transcriptional regulator with XRE-family HTH domain
MVSNIIKDLIFSKYCSEAECARVVGWSRQKLNRITTFKREPDLVEIDQLAVCLDLSFEYLANIFLLKWSPNEQQNTDEKVS